MMQFWWMTSFLFTNDLAHIQGKSAQVDWRNNDQMLTDHLPVPFDMA
jgi:hypothetical protein